MDKKEKQNMERDERYVRRRKLEEAGEAEKEDTSAPKKPRLDLLDVLNPTASVLDILAASGVKPLSTMSEDQINKETDTGDEVSSNRPGVLDIFDFEFEPLESEPMEVPAEDKEAVEVGFNSILRNSLVVDILSKVAMQAFLEEALLKTSEKEAATAGEIIAIVPTGAAEEGASDLLVPLGDQSLEADTHAPLAAMDDIPNSRQN